MKLAIVGGGSTYTPELIDGFARLRATLPIDEVWLVDPNQERVSLVAGVSQRMFARAGHPGRVIATTDLIAGVSDADAVLIQLRVGGQDARRGDETWPHEVHCIGQETTGPGGLAKALRTVPVVLRVAAAVREHAKPDAWIVDFTNPVGIVTRALLQEGHRAVGLCNVAIGFQRRFAGMLGVDPDRVELGHVGLNHLTWERSIRVDGTDRLPELLGSQLGTLAEEVELRPELLSMLGVVPSYYLRYYYAHDEVLDEQRHEPPRADAVQAVERELLALYADPAVDTKPAALEQRGGAFYSEAAIELLSGLVGDTGQTRVVNVRNDGALPFLPDDHVIEVPARVRASGLEVLPIEPLDDDIRGLISAVAGYERLALDAAIHGSTHAVLRAMQAHPLVLQYERAEKLTELLISHNRDHLAWAK
ncbi:MAG: 6-phospho-beta-glucosidase [Pseudolysinimonas sp.]